MKSIVCIVALISAGVSQTLAQTTIAQWTFDGATSADIPGGPVNPTASSGSGSLQLTGGVTATFGSGTGSSDPVSPTTSNFSWQTTSYPGAGTASATGGIVIAVSTAGFHSINLSFDQRLSSTSNNTWIVYATADITQSTPVWTSVKTFTFTPTASGTGDTWYDQRFVDLSAFTSLNDNPHMAVRIVSAFDPVAGNYLAAASNKTYATTGNSRFDMISVLGVADVVVINTAPVVQNASVTGQLNVGDTLHATYTYSDAEGDKEGSSWLSWFRADDASGTDADSITTNTTRDYILTNTDLNKFIAFEVIPVAQTGVSRGVAFRTTFQGPVSQSLDVLLYPQPFDISKKNFKFNNWLASSAAGTYPAGMVFQQFNAESYSAGASPTALWQCVYNLASHSRVIGLDDGGVGFINSSDEQSATDCGNGSNTGGYVGTAVLALNTIGVTNMTLSWSSTLISNGNGTPPREYHLGAEYRLAGTNEWISFGSSYDFSSATAAVGMPIIYSLVLPAAVEGQGDVFIRWIYYQKDVGASGTRPEISIGNISVTNPNAPNSAPVASAVSFSGLQLINQIQTGAYVYTDPEGDVEGVSLKQWFRADDASGANASAIPGATTATYSTTAADAGKYIAFAVQPVAQTGNTQGIPTASFYGGPVLNYGDPNLIKINEVYSRGSSFEADPKLKADWVEFYNPGTLDITLAGLQICDSGPCQTLPQSAYAALIVPSKGFLALSQNDPNSFTFGLSSLGEYAVLKRPDTKATIDSLNFPALDSTRSFGRYPDGASHVATLFTPTKAASNNSTITTGLEPEIYSVSVFPNPSRDYIMVSSSDHPVKQISLTTITGQELIKVLPEGTVTRVSLSDVSNGFYVLIITLQRGGRVVRKIVKE